MNILYVAPSNSIHTKRWINRASKNGINCFLYDQIPGGGDRIDSCKNTYFVQKINVFKPLIFLKPLLYTLFHFVKLRKVIKKNDFDLIHIHWLFDFSVLASTFQRRIKIVITPWGSDIQYSPNSNRLRSVKIAFNKFLIRRIARKTDAVCCDSIAQKEILEKAGTPSKKIHIIYFGTDVNAYSPENRKVNLREKYGANESSVLVISNRSHEPVYDLETFIRASKIAYEGNRDLRFVLAGSGSLTSNYKQLISELDLKSIYYLPGRMDDEEFSCSTASCDIYVSTSKSDGGLAASTAEAMASGLPVLISDFGENASWLKNESAGMVFPIGDYKKLADQIIMLSKNQADRNQRGKIGRAIISEFNNSEIEWQKVEKLYSNLI
jgi:glycosyltransferase involved in cell wall biosynthesis